MEKVRQVVLAVSVVLLSLLAVLACSSPFGERWTDHSISQIEFTEDRAGILLWVGGYVNESCNEIDATIDKTNDVWAVSYRSRKSSKFCQLALPIYPEGADNIIELEQPAPDGVTLVVASD